MQMNGVCTSDHHHVQTKCPRKKFNRQFPIRYVLYCGLISNLCISINALFTFAQIDSLELIKWANFTAIGLVFLVPSFDRFHASSFKFENVLLNLLPASRNVLNDSCEIMSLNCGIGLIFCLIGCSFLVDAKMLMSIEELENNLNGGTETSNESNGQDRINLSMPGKNSVSN